MNVTTRLGLCRRSRVPGMKCDEERRRPGGVVWCGVRGDGGSGGMEGGEWDGMNGMWWTAWLLAWRGDFGVDRGMRVWVLW